MRFPPLYQNDQPTNSPIPPHSLSLPPHTLSLPLSEPPPPTHTHPPTHRVKDILANAAAPPSSKLLTRILETFPELGPKLQFFG
jgi:hypothetical protein